jgi:hypothetical protein
MVCPIRVPVEAPPPTLVAVAPALAALYLVPADRGRPVVVDRRIPVQVSRNAVAGELIQLWVSLIGIVAAQRKPPIPALITIPGAEGGQDED